MPLEQKPLKLYIYDSRFSRSTNDFKTLSLNETTHSLENHVYLFENEDFPIYWFLPTADRCWWEFRAAITRLDFSDLNEILLEKQSKYFTIHWLCGTVGKLVADIISFKRPWNWLLTSNQYQLSAIIKQILLLYVLKIALFGRLWLPVTKQIPWVWIPLKPEWMRFNIIWG